MTSGITAQNLRKSFSTHEGVVTALDDVSFEVERGKFFTLLGPSGCGKTTTLRSVAGLERPNDGEIAIGGKTVFSSHRKLFVPGNRRDVGMVFQSYAIWPHMSVYENVAFPLKVRKAPERLIRSQALEALGLVGLAELADRSATQLSGGQQQRVALARALVAKPKLLLLDEPLSNLDAKLRMQMRWEIKDLQSRLETTTLYVTHDQVEALAISDEIALMNKGRIIQIGTPKEIYRNPINEFAADFIGAANIIYGELLEGPDERRRSRVKTDLGEFNATAQPGIGEIGKGVLIAFRPENVFISSTARPNGQNVLEGELQGFTYLGECAEFNVAVGSRRIQVRGDAGMELKKGMTLYLQIPAEKCLAIRRGEI
jgi:iron(III) transport system ATP-binding protein